MRPIGPPLSRFTTAQTGRWVTCQFGVDLVQHLCHFAMLRDVGLGIEVHGVCGVRRIDGDDVQPAELAGGTARW